MAGGPSAAVAEAMRGRQKAVDPDRLKKMKLEVDRVRVLDAEIADLEQQITGKKDAKNKILTKTLPDMFQELGIKSLELEASGNMPAYEAKSAPYYHANIKSEWTDEQKQAAFALLKTRKAPDLTKTTIKAELPKGSAGVAKKAIAALRKLRVPIEISKGVHSSTLTAWVRELYESNGSLSDREKEVLGASVGTIVSIKPKKERANKATKETT